MQESYHYISNIESKPSVEQIVDSLNRKLPIIAPKLITANLDLSHERNRSFLENPDNPLEHKPTWHQWGVITHTQMFEKYFREEVPIYLDRWGMLEIVQRKMAQTIDGLSKYQLSNISIPLHDLGKFTNRSLHHQHDGSVLTKFVGHEAASGQIVRTKDFSEMMSRDYSLTPAQIEYIAQCAELHYRISHDDETKKADLKHGFTYARSDYFKSQCQKLMAQKQNFQLEIALLFLGDSLAKTDIRINSDSDEQTQSQELSIQKLLLEKKLNPMLIQAVKQIPVNIASTKTYLDVWLDTL